MKRRKIIAGIMAFCMLAGNVLPAAAETNFNPILHAWKLLSKGQNSYSISGQSRFLTESHYNTFCNSLTNTELYHAMETYGKTYQDAEYGMAATSMLAYNGLIPYEEYYTFGDFEFVGLYDMGNGNRSELYSLISYYQMLLEGHAMQQYLAKQALTTDSTQRLQMLVQALEEGRTAIITTTYDSHFNEHTLLACNLEYGSFEWEGTVYDGKIHIYNPQKDLTDASEAQKDAIYFNSEDWSWYIPRYEKSNSAEGGLILSVCDDVNVVNTNGLHGGTPYTPDDSFLHMLTFPKSDGYTVQAVNAAEQPSDLVQLDDTHYYSGNPVKMAVSQETGEISGTIEYYDTIQEMSGSAVSQLITDPSGSMEIIGTDTDYTMGMVSNEGLYAGSWHHFQVSGSGADQASLQRTDAGYVLTADVMEDVSVTAKGFDSLATLTFSSEADRVLLYEINSYTLGAAEDTDGDGAYETTIATTTDPCNGTFRWGRNNWAFRNTSNIFGESYTYTDADRINLKQHLSNIERHTAGELIDGNFLGSCYGMAALSILSCYDLIDYSAYRVYNSQTRKGPAISLFDIGPDPRTDLISMINYYQALQYTEEIRQYTAWNMLHKTEAERLQQLIDNTEAGIPSMLAFFKDFDPNTGERNGHAVVAYDIEYGEFELYEDQLSDDGSYSPDKPTFIADGRILIYDNANLFETTTYLYFNTETMSWLYQGASNERGGVLSMILSDPALLNAKGTLAGTESYTRPTDFLPILTVSALDSEYEVEKISYVNGAWEAVESVDEIKAFPTFLESGTVDKGQHFVMTDAESGYTLSSLDPEIMNLEMNYEHSLMIAKPQGADSVAFHPDGFVEISGEKSDYTLEMIFNDGHYQGSWYDFSVTGIGRTASLRKTEDGYVLTAANLDNVRVEACGDTAEASLTFSAPVHSVLLYEEEAETIGVRADVDGDGTYETPVEELTAQSVGDMNADAVVNSTDAAELLIAAAAAGSGTDTGLTAVQKYAADVNKDGTLDAVDASLILRYAAAVGTGSTQTMDEFLADVL